MCYLLIHGYVCVFPKTRVRYALDPVLAVHRVPSHPGCSVCRPNRYVWNPVDAEHALLSHCPPSAAPHHHGGQQHPCGQHGLQRLTVCALDLTLHQACLLVSPLSLPLCHSVWAVGLVGGGRFWGVGVG